MSKKTCIISRESIDSFETLLMSLDKSATVSYLFVDLLEELFTAGSACEFFKGETDTGLPIDLYNVVVALRSELDLTIRCHHELTELLDVMSQEARENKRVDTIEL